MTNEYLNLMFTGCRATGIPALCLLLFLNKQCTVIR